PAILAQATFPPIGVCGRVLGERTDTVPAGADHGQGAEMQRRTFLRLSAAAAASAAFPLPGRAGGGKPCTLGAARPLGAAGAVMEGMKEHRGEDPRYLRARFERFQNMVGHVDLWEARNKRAFLMTPREEFCRPETRAVIYDVNYHDIGFGVTITGPRVVGRM